MAFNEPGSEALIVAILPIALEADPEILIEQHREQHLGRDLRAAPAILATISAPTLVLHGELDRSVPLAVANAVAAAIPGATRDVAVAGGHRPDIRSPELVNPACRLPVRPAADRRRWYRDPAEADVLNTT